MPEDLGPKGRLVQMGSWTLTSLSTPVILRLLFNALYLSFIIGSQSSQIDPSVRAREDPLNACHMITYDIDQEVVRELSSNPNDPYSTLGATRWKKVELHKLSFHLHM